MTVLVWISVLFGVWCVASIATALALGTYIRRRREATDPDGALRALDTGPLHLWVDSGISLVPDTPAQLDEVCRVPAPRPPGDTAAARASEPLHR